MQYKDIFNILNHESLGISVGVIKINKLKLI